MERSPSQPTQAQKPFAWTLAHLQHKAAKSFAAAAKTGVRAVGERGQRARARVAEIPGSGASREAEELREKGKCHLSWSGGRKSQWDFVAFRRVSSRLCQKGERVIIAMGARWGTPGHGTVSPGHVCPHSTCPGKPGV